MQEQHAARDEGGKNNAVVAVTAPPQGLYKAYFKTIPISKALLTLTFYYILRVNILITIIQFAHAGSVNTVVYGCFAVLMERVATFFLLFYSVGGRLKTPDREFWKCLLATVFFLDLIYAGLRVPQTFRQELGMRSFRELQKVFELCLQLTIIANVTAMQLFLTRIARSLRTDGTLAETRPFTTLTFNTFFSILFMSFRLYALYQRRSQSARNYNLTRRKYPTYASLTDEQRDIVFYPKFALIHAVFAFRRRQAQRVTNFFCACINPMPVRQRVWLFALIVLQISGNVFAFGLWSLNLFVPSYGFLSDDTVATPQGRANNTPGERVPYQWTTTVFLVCVGVAGVAGVTIQSHAHVWRIVLCGTKSCARGTLLAVMFFVGHMFDFQSHMREEIPLVFHNKVVHENWIDNQMPGYVTVIWRLFWMGLMTFLPKHYYFHARALTQTQIDAIEDLWEVRYPQYVFYASACVYALHYAVRCVTAWNGIDMEHADEYRHNDKIKRVRQYEQQEQQQPQHQQQVVEMNYVKASAV